MSTRFVSGDLMHDGGLDAIAHGCNCAGAMGKGVAVQFRARFPRMYAEYKRRCADGRFNLGDVFVWTENGMTVYNLGTQTTWRTKANLHAIETAVRLMIRLAEENGIRRIGLPRIGAGLGGLEWTVVRDVLQRVGEQTIVELVIFEDYTPAASSRSTPT